VSQNVRRSGLAKGAPNAGHVSQPSTFSFIEANFPRHRRGSLSARRRVIWRGSMPTSRRRAGHGRLDDGQLLPRSKLDRSVSVTSVVQSLAPAAGRGYQRDPPITRCSAPLRSADDAGAGTQMSLGYRFDP
jgi:hypothetical protein